MNAWRAVVDLIRLKNPAIAAVLAQAAPLEVQPACVVIGFPPNSILYTKLTESENDENEKLLPNALKEVLKSSPSISIERTEEAARSQTLDWIEAHERYKRQESLRQEALSHPLVKAAQELLRVEKIEVRLK